MAERRGARCTGERGSVLLLGLGLAGVVCLALAVIVDGAALVLQRQQLLAGADAAALSGVQAIDLNAYYANGAGRGTRLDPGGAAAAAASSVRAHAQREPGVRLETAGSDGVTVTVEVSAPIVLPFPLIVAGHDRMRVRSTARLDQWP